MIDVCFSHFQIQFACSPNQADFVQVTKQERYGNESLDSVGSEVISSFLCSDCFQQVVTTLYSVPTKFTQTFWDSCKVVLLSPVFFDTRRL